MRNIILLLTIIMAFTPIVKADDNFFYLTHLLNLAKLDPHEVRSKDKIYIKQNILFCTGQSTVAVQNNRAANLMKAGKYKNAIKILEQSLKKSALFFPFRYNLGTCYLHTNNLKKALLNFQKARAVVPEYSQTYLKIGTIYQRWYRDNEAIEYYRKALIRNKKELNTFILIGDLFLQRNQIEIAKKYYNASLKINHRFANGILGKAKIYYKKKEYYKTLVLLKSINLRGEYDKAFHYYYAECAFKLGEYKTASYHYTMLLKYKNDKFFLTNSIALIRYKLNLSNRFFEK